ncbi:MAG: CotH kinase family protein [Bacteroidota bacterium]|nr:CotH kinase family protein [Bacteroidota bacterium]
MIPSSFVIPANGVAIIYCSGRDELIGGNAHSNFKITQTKGNEVLMLTDAGNIFQDSIRVLPNQKSHTRGRESNGAAIWGVFLNGTPNATNAVPMQEYATTPVFSQVGGYNAAAINLTLSSPDPNITIYYTTNGDEPNNTSTVYASPINIATTTVVKAIAYSSTSNIPASFIDYHTFFINDTHTIPILSISGDNGQGGLLDLLDGGWGSSGLEPEGTIEWFDENGILLDKGTGEFNKHGNDSWAYDQRGFDYIMRDQFGYNYALQDEIFATKNRDKFQRVIVKAAANDNYPFSYGGSGAHIRDAYVHHLSQIGDLRLDERSTSSCILYLDGNYWGVYEMREKVDDHDFTDYYYDQDRNNLQYLKTWGATWTEYGAPNAQIDWDNFVNFVNTNPMVNQANYNQAKSEYNTGSLIDYFLLNSYVVCQDWLNWNTAWWRGMDPNGDKKKWRYTLWDMDNTFDHGTNYTGIPSSSPTAEPCDPSTLGNTGGQGHVPIWNEMLTNQEFHDDYINRWQDLANGPLSCSFMIHILDSMVAVIDPEMPRQISTWGGTYTGWQNNVTDLRNFILARCDSMNSGFVDCDSSITGIFDVTIEIIGIGEVEMSNNNIVNNFNTPFTDQRFGGIALPFEVVSGAFSHWEVVSTTSYIYDPNVDTLVIDLQSDVIVKAHFGEKKDIIFDVVPSGTTTSININGTVVNVFPYTASLLVDENIGLTPIIDPSYGFDSWSSDSNILSPSGLTEIISFTVAYSDTIKLHLYQKPTIVYDINPPGTTTTIEINGSVISVFPYSETVFIDNLNILNPNIDPNYGFGFWNSNYNTLLNGGSINNSFYGIYNDTITLNLSSVSAFIAGNDTICENSQDGAKISVYFTGISPFTFNFTIDGIIQPPITTTINPHIITTKIGGNYSLASYNDANEFGTLSGQAMVTILSPPIAQFNAQPDSMTILFTTTKLVDNSVGNIIGWIWDFGDNTTNEFIQSPYHTYPDSIAIYQIGLIVHDDQGCADTTQNLITITDNYWIYIPNSFTPDHDGVNDKFCLAYNGIRDATFIFNVFDRFSNLVYATNNIQDLSCENGWDGTHYETGNDLPMGTYIYQIYYQDFEGWKHQETSELTIVR